MSPSPSLWRGASTLALATALALPAAPLQATTIDLDTVNVHAQKRPARAASSARPIVVRRAPASGPPPATPAPTRAAAPSIPPIVQKYKLPQTTASTTRREIDEKVNVVDTEDAVKYFPSLFLRKRNDGDTQAVLATRTWGLSSSARTLVYADDVPISALIANNNTIGAPRWGFVAPEEIQRIDFLYGPFAAAYPGNSIGGVLNITTRMPDHLEANAKQTAAFQTFDLYKTHKSLATEQTSASIGDRAEDLSWFVSANYLHGATQPLFFITAGSAPKGSGGTIPALNKTGQTADVVGAGGLLVTDQVNAKLKLALDITPWLKATYALGFWSNVGQSYDQSYLTTAGGAPTFGGVAGFANQRYSISEQHIGNALSLKTDTKGAFDWEAVVSNYYFLNDTQRNPFGVLPTGEAFTTNGKVTSLTGTNWTNVDLKGIWRPFGHYGDHEISFGLHGDEYDLRNPTFATADWMDASSPLGAVYSNGRGTTQTGALWAQDAWTFAPHWTLTTGGRLEHWQALDGFNLNTTASSTGLITSTTAVDQPKRSDTTFSPKATLAWAPDPQWLVKGSFGESYRFPTVSELYQIVSTGGTFSIPNSNLKPEQDFSEDLTVEHRWDDYHGRVSLFWENTDQALISQTNFVNQTAVTSVTNVDAIRNRGVEIEAGKQNAFVEGLELSGSVTYVDSRILSDPEFASTTGTTAKGKHVPNVPDWRATLVGTYRWDNHWAFTVAGRYSGKQYSTLDNTDTTSHVFGAFDNYIVVDTRLHYDYNQMASLDLGIDNLNNEKYFLFHPFPGRTFLVDAHIKF